LQDALQVIRIRDDHAALRPRADFLDGRNRGILGPGPARSTCWGSPTTGPGPARDTGW
jgi:hypothetical protein